MARIAVLLADGFDDSEFRVPYDRLQEAGHDLMILGHERGELVHGKLAVDETWIEDGVSNHTADEFDGVVIPGGYSTAELRVDEDALQFVRDCVVSGKLVAAVCHGPQVLISAGVVNGRRVTAWPSVRVDAENAGAEWIDRAVVVDGNLITSRRPEDLESFCDAILGKLSTTSAGREATAAERASSHPA